MPDLAARLETILKRWEMTHSGGARLLGIDERTMRRWLARDTATPQAVVMLLQLVDETSRRTGKPPREVLERLGRICAVEKAQDDTEGLGMAREGAEVAG